MALRHFIARRRVLHHEARRYVVRRPTWATVHLVLALYPKEIVAVARAARDYPDLPIRDSLWTLFKIDERAHAVLDTCVDTESPPVEWPLRLLADAALSLVDFNYIRERIASVVADTPDDIADSVGVPELSPSDDEIALVKLAERFHCSPIDVMDWPYEAYLATVSVIETINARPEGATAADDAYTRAQREYLSKVH